MLAALAALAALSGCRQFEQHRADLASLHAAGQYAQIAQVLDDPQTKTLYGRNSDVLWKLDRGATALALDDAPTTVRLLEEAEQAIERRREKSGADAAAQWLLNDAAAAYIAEPYEDIYVNVLKLLAQLESGQIQGGATVEARRLASKADQLRDRFLTYQDAVAKENPEALDRAREGAGGAVVSVTRGGEFVESTLGTYLTAITFMKTGEDQLQAVAARRLQDSIRLQGPLIGPVQGERFAALENTRPADVNVLAVALSGRGPTKVAQTVGPIPLGTVPIYFELPVLQASPSEVAAARLEVEGLGTDGQVPLALVEDLSSVAAENHRRMLPLIYARTYARAAAKAIASVALTEGMRKGAKDDNQAGVQILGVLAGLAFMYATEKADVRAWAMLPGQAHVAAARLPAGQHRVRVVFEGPGGGALHATPWQTINVTERGLATVVSHYWR